MIGLNLNDTIITPYIQMEFFYFKTKFFGFQIIDIDNQRTLIDKQPDENSYKNQHFIVICNHAWFICFDDNLIYFQLLEHIIHEMLTGQNHKKNYNVRNIFALLNMLVTKMPCYSI